MAAWRRGRELKLARLRRARPLNRKTRGESVERMKLPDGFVDLLRKPSPCFLTTLMPDGSPQMTETWVDTDGEHVIINTVQTHLKVKNIERDPRVAVAVCDAADLPPLLRDPRARRGGHHRGRRGAHRGALPALHRRRRTPGTEAAIRFA